MPVTLTFVEMEAARQKVRAIAARKKKEERRAKGKEGASSSAPKVVSNVPAKRKAVGKDGHPPKKAVVTLRDAHPKKKSPPKLSHDVGKGMMTSIGPVVEGFRRLLTHMDYALETMESFIKLTDVKPYAELGTEELGASTLFYHSWVSSFSWLILSHLFLFID